MQEACWVWLPFGPQGVRGLGFRVQVQHLKSEHSLVKQLVKGWNKTPPTQETHNIEKIQSPLNTFPVGLKLKVQLAENPKFNSQTGEGGVGGGGPSFGVVLEANFPSQGGTFEKP